MFYVIIFSCWIATSCQQGKHQKNNAHETLQHSIKTVYPKLLLLSKGFTTDTLIHAFISLLDEEPNAQSIAIVVNASTTEKKKHKKTKKAKARFSSMGFDSSKVMLFDLLKRAPKDLAEFDIIYILGGNPFLLLKEVNQSNAGRILKNLAFEQKLIVGYSAGSLLLGPDLFLMNDLDDILEFNDTELKDFSCLKLYNFHIFPHFKEFTSELPTLGQRIAQYEKRCPFPIYRLNNNQGIIYKDGTIEIVGK